MRPTLHELVTTVAAPVMALSDRDGQIRRGGAAGWYHGDRRSLSAALLTVDGQPPVPLRWHLDDAGRAHFLGAVPGLGDPGPDPSVLVERTRDAAAGTEAIAVLSHAAEPVRCTVALELGADLAPLPEVRAGAPTTGPAPVAEAGGPGWRAADGATARVVPDRPADEVDGGTLRWHVTVEPGRRAGITLTVTLAGDPVPPVLVPASAAVLARPEIRADDRRLAPLLTRGHADLTGLLAADARDPRDHVLTAGAPWYLTLFGRDSLWAARMLLPAGTALAAGTLRALAARQGRRTDPDAAEQPGRIPHELRRARTAHPDAARTGGLSLPPVYYGSVDATPLWISLLHDAWRWGLPAAEIEPLLPHLEAALGWLRDDATDRDGFVSYRDESGHGLANQGWKDSGNSVRFRDGMRAEAPIALCEAQGYAHAAARQAADLLDGFGRPGGAWWRDWAAALADRFRRRFWVDDPVGPFPAIALDATGRPVDTVTSNIGHLLGTGLLTPAEADLVVTRLAGPGLDGGHGLRTLSADTTGYQPLSYHNGSVWTHDTAIAVAGLAATGTPAARDAAASLIHGLLRAAPAFGHRLPELHGGQPAADGPPVPHPTACAPQAWAAAAPYALVTAALGLVPDVPSGTCALAPLRPSPFGALRARGLRVGGHDLDVDLTADGTATVTRTPPGLRTLVS